MAKVKSNRGRKTKYKPEYVEQVYSLCAEFGADDKKLAKFFDVSKVTINAWKREYPEFLNSLKKGKDDYDTEKVQASLLGRALGYQYTETIQEPTDDGFVVTKKITKQQAPDVTAQIFWLKNRQPNRWRDKQHFEHSGEIENRFSHMTDEELKKRFIELGGKC